MSEIFDIIKNYIDGAIIIFSIENYYFKDNYELIAKLYKVINKKITNFLVLLNKMDLSTDHEKDIDKFKGEVIKHFPKCQTFNLNLNTFIPLSLIQVEHELLMDNSFRHFIYYHFNNYYLNVKDIKAPKANIPSFIDHLIDIIKPNENNNVNEIKKEIDKLEDKIKEEIKSVIRDLLNEFEKNEKIKFGFYQGDINDDKENDDNSDDSDDEEIKESNSIESLKPFSIIQLLYIYYKEKKLKSNLSSTTEELINYFENKRMQNTLITSKKPENHVKTIETIFSNQLNIFIDVLKKSKIDVKNIKSLIDEINDTREFVKKSNYIFVSFLGPSNAGKTTIINGIIGRDILPTDLNECTKRGIIISYSDEGEENITISTSCFLQVKYLDKIYYYFKEDQVIGKGLAQVKNTLKGLNYEFTDKEEDSFYYIKTKIKLFDELGLNDNLKKMIYLIDIPGYGTSNKFLEKDICKKILSMSSAFIFVLRNAIIKENNTKSILDYIFNETKIQKEKVYSGIIKSCSFILNIDKSYNAGDEDLAKAKKDIQQIIGNENEKQENDINLCFFNAKYYIDYCNDFTYFFNLEETFENECKNYKIIKNNKFKYPRLYGNKKDRTFFEFLYKQLNDILKTKFGIKKKITSQNIHDNIREKIKVIYDDLTEKKYINMEEILNKGDKIIQIFSYGQDKIKELSTFKESNIDNLKKLLNYKFNHINADIKEKLKNKIGKLLCTSDEFFKIDFSDGNPKEKKEIELFNCRMENILKRIKDMAKENIRKINNIFEAYKKFFENNLNNQKAEIEKSLKTKNYKNILNEIDEEIKGELQDLNNKIMEIINGFNKKSIAIFEEANKEICEFSQEKTKLELYTDFYNYFQNKIGDRDNIDLCEQLFIEIKSNKSFSKIYESK